MQRLTLSNYDLIFFPFREQGWPFMPTRLWVGVWSAVLLLIQVVTDASALVAFITRFTEECFATLISVVFVISAVEQLLHILDVYPLSTDFKVKSSDFKCGIHTKVIV